MAKGKGGPQGARVPAGLIRLQTRVKDGGVYYVVGE
jgi:hypothetical protein